MSSIYKGAEMPYMERVTWGGIALHAGDLPGYPDSHGCVRLPLEFSKLLFGVTMKGATVIIANTHTLRPRQPCVPVSSFPGAARRVSRLLPGNLTGIQTSPPPAGFRNRQQRG